jgi:hypothetical protein
MILSFYFLGSFGGIVGALKGNKNGGLALILSLDASYGV